jgi:hypothetical protein
VSGDEDKQASEQATENKKEREGGKIGWVTVETSARPMCLSIFLPSVVLARLARFWKDLHWFMCGDVIKK